MHDAPTVRPLIAFDPRPREAGEKRPAPTQRQLIRAKHRKLSSKPSRPLKPAASALSANRLNAQVFRQRFLQRDPATNQLTGCVRKCCSGQACLRTLAGCTGSDGEITAVAFEEFLTRVTETRNGIYQGKTQDASRDDLLDLLKKNWQPCQDAPAAVADGQGADGPCSAGGVQLYIWRGMKVRTRGPNPCPTYLDPPPTHRHPPTCSRSKWRSAILLFP